MILRGIDFGVVHGASGVQNFFGEGYEWHKAMDHPLLGPARLGFRGMTFVAKTTTLHAREGNMPLREGSTHPKSLLPRAIAVNPFRGAVVNSVGLSGPGAEWLFDRRIWQSLPDPFFLSFMSVKPTPEERVEETEQFTKLSRRYLSDFSAPVGLQLNLSCPNVEHAPDDVVAEAYAALDVLQALNIPVVVKLSVTTPPEVAAQIAKHPACDGLCVSNTIPWGARIPWAPEGLQVNWWKLWLSHTSPVARKLKDPEKKGGLSGRPVTKLVRAWLRRYRRIDLDTPMCVGGGVNSVRDARVLMNLGANAVFIGSMAILRPFGVQRTINTINREYARK